MRKLYLVAALLMATAFGAFSQKIIDKKIEVNGQKAKMKLSFADDIKVEAWNNDYIGFHVSANIDTNKYNEYYGLKIDNSSGKIEIVEDVDFEAIKEKVGSKNLCNFEMDINYSLKVPRNLNFEIETISGEVELIGCEGEMEINSISGFIDYSIPEKLEAKIDLSTVTGDVYSNINFDNPVSRDITWVGTKRKLSLNGGTRDVELKTVSGDIFLRKL
jgi:DUF4097 and DUF4098 domain-containing protein YvlB